MPSPQTLALFLGVTLAMLAVPGPSVLFAFARSMEQGRRAGLCAVAGLEAGMLIHVIAASVGISGLVASSPATLNVLKYGGAAYLAYLGVTQLLQARLAGTPATTPPSVQRGYAQLFRDGLLIDLLNPKTVLFFLALLPQFVDPARGSVGRQSLLLGLVVVALAFVCDGSYALVAGAVRRRQGTPGMSRGMTRASGTAFVGLAVLAGVS